MKTKPLHVLPFRIERFGSCEYKFNDIILRDKKETLAYLKKNSLEDFFEEDIQTYWISDAESVALSKLRLPCILQLEYTYKCPLKCKYCYSGSGPDRKEIMNFDKFKNLIENINKQDIFEIYVLGGEPTMFPKYFTFLLNNLDGKNITIGTNGVFVNELMCETVNKSREKNEICFTIGIDGASEEIHNASRGRFDAVCNTLNLFDKYKIPTIATTCVTNYNCNALEPLVEFLIEKSVRAVQILPIEMQHLKPEIVEELKPKIAYQKLCDSITNLVAKYDKDIKFDISFQIPGYANLKTADGVSFGPCTSAITSACINTKGYLTACPPVQKIEISLDNGLETAFARLRENVLHVSQKDNLLITRPACANLGYGRTR